MMKNMKANFGHDWKWWFLPTRPVLKINFFERLYSIKQIKRLRTYDEDDSDPDNKLFAAERSKSKREKYTILATTLLFTGWWLAAGRFTAQEMWV